MTIMPTKLYVPSGVVRGSWVYSPMSDRMIPQGYAKKENNLNT